MKLTIEQVNNVVKALENSAENLKSYSAKQIAKGNELDITDKDIRVELHDLLVKLGLN